MAFAAATFNALPSVGAVTITVNRSGDTSGPVIVTYTTIDGSAVAGTDYDSAVGTLSWASGDGTPKSFVLPIASASSGSHYVQLGAFRSEASAASQWKHLSVRYARELGARTPRYVAGHSERGKIVRPEVGVESRGEAKALCAKLKAHAQSCLPISAG